MNKVYISGPMTGIKNLNADAFYNAERSLKENGRHPVNPHRIGKELVLSGGLPENESDHYNAYMRADIAALMACDEILMLQGWGESKGASIEFATAKMVGIPVRYEE